MIALISWAAGGALVDCQGCHGASLLPNTLKKFSSHCWRIVVMFMSRRIVFVMHRVQSVHTTNYERTSGNFFTTLGKFLVM